MTRRSLNTFMNALTGSDFTCYPAASQVPKDFYNLLDVYLDAVFHPNLARMSFLQEGHRLEFANPTDPDTLLEHKGVVFNEMKGALASPATRLSEAMHAALFPNLTYGINSGGNPRVIPELTYEELVAFHQTFYHPSRCLFFFCGNMPLEPHLDFIATHALKGVEKVPELPPIPRQPRFDKPRYLTDTYPISADEDSREKTLISFGWLTCSILEQQELLALSILEIILMDTDASLLKKALLKSGLCKLASSHIDMDVTECPLMLTLRGCNPEDADACEHLIRTTLQSIADHGIPLQLVENALHQVELHRSEIGSDHAPFGLSLFMRSALLKQHKVAPEEGLKIHSLFESLHQKILLDPHYFSHLIKKHLIANPHFVRIVMTPDKELSAHELAEERAALDKIRAQMTQEEIRHLVHQAAELAAFQKKQEDEDTDVLPKVTLDDVPRYAQQFPLHIEKVGSLNVYHHACFTNTIVYANLYYDLPEIAEEDLAYVRLMANIMPQMGAGGRTYAENLEYMQAHTGGIGVGLHFNFQATNHESFKPSLSIRSKALHRKAPKLFPLIQDMVTSVDFTDEHRLIEVIQKHYTGLESTLSSSALKYALSLAFSGLDVASKISNSWNGMEYYWTLRKIAQNLKEEIKPLMKKLQKLQDKLLGVENPDLVITCEAGFYDELKGHGFYGLARIDTKPAAPWKANYSLTPIESQGRVIASPVAFTTKVMNTVSYIDPDTAALSIAVCLFDNLTLHRLLREQGGAYGGGTSANALAGTLYFYSFRDPNIASTLNAFEEAVKEVIKGKFDESDLEEAKLEIIQGLDDPIAPGRRGDYAYGWLREGKTTEIRQTFRERILNMKKEDVVSAVKRIIVPQIAMAPTVVFAGRELLEKENAALKAEGRPELILLSI